MSGTALTLLVLSGLLHASWNLLLKQSPAREAVNVGALVVAATCAAPLLFFTPLRWSSALPFLLASGALNVVYFLVLIRAYARGDFSQVYPIARGTAPAFLALWAVLFLRERPSPLGVAGLAILVVGLMLVGRGGWTTRVARGTASALLAVGVAILVSLYSVVDGAAVKRHDPIAYSAALFVIVAVLMLPVAARRQGARSLALAWRAEWMRTIAVGVLGFGSYTCALGAYRLALVSYAGAAREVGIVFGALGGWLVLGERFGGWRLAGSALIFAAVVLLAQAR